MASLLTVTEKSGLGGIYDDLFDTFSRPIVIHKEPLKVISSINSTPVFGYSNEDLPESVTFTPVTGIFQARIIYKGDKDNLKVQPLATDLPIAESFVRVKQEAKDFIMNGKTEKITFDDKTWNMQYGFVVRRYIDSIYYEFSLKEAT
jgi:hypothetical protein